MLFTDVDVVTI